MSSSKPLPNSSSATILPPANKAFVPRDYSHGTELRFSTELPAKLQGRIPEEVFTAVIGNINQLLIAAETGSASVYLESCFACLTGYLAYICMETQYEKPIPVNSTTKCLRSVSRLVEEYNRTVFGPRNLSMIDPSERGLRVIEIVLLRP
uniref:Ras modification protein ERF4 n=1 Tax=Macrostomum lignano TaxID=282301 RepID=A0A1I8G466_9PLAT